MNPLDESFEEEEKPPSTNAALDFYRTSYRADEDQINESLEGESLAASIINKYRNAPNVSTSLVRSSQTNPKFSSHFQNSREFSVHNETEVGEEIEEPVIPVEISQVQEEVPLVKESLQSIKFDLMS